MDFPAGPLPAVPFLKLAAVANEGGGLTLFAQNRDLEGGMALDVTARGLPGMELAEATTLRHADLKAVNTSVAPNCVAPVTLDGVKVEGDRITVTLPPASWNMIRLKT